MQPAPHPPQARRTLRLCPLFMPLNPPSLPCFRALEGSAHFEILNHAHSLCLALTHRCHVGSFMSFKRRQPGKRYISSSGISMHGLLIPSSVDVRTYAPAYQVRVETRPLLCAGQPQRPGGAAASTGAAWSVRAPNSEKVRQHHTAQSTVCVRRLHEQSSCSTPRSRGRALDYPKTILVTMT